MKKTIRDLYARVVNLQQFFTYGKAWMLLPFTVLLIASNIGVLFIYFNIPRVPLLLETIVVISIVGMVVVGKVMFRVKAQQADILMGMWRPAFHLMTYLGVAVGTFLALEELGVPVPEMFAEWHITEWKHFKALSKYILEKGKQAGALPLVKEFMESLPDE